MQINDQGPKPYVVNIEDVTLKNENFRTTLWTGSNLQTTLMAIEVGGEVGLEVHHDHDQFLRVEQGAATVYLGSAEDALEEYNATDDYAVFVPAGTWHNLVNSGEDVLKLYSIYAPPEHPRGTVHKTKDDASEEDE